jgi:hypothetical protein
MALTRLGPNQAVNLSTNTTGTLGVANGGTGITSGTTDQFLKFTGTTTIASAADNTGVEEYDMWVVTSSFGNIPGYIASNWSRFSDTGFEKIGTGVSNSSATFSFPSTGKYRLFFQAQFYVNTTNENRYFQTWINFSNDSWGSEHRLGETYTYITGGVANSYSTCTSTAMVDITNTTNDTVRFGLGSDNDAAWALCYASSSSLSTYATFEKLGDT